ncbi:MAG TPA: Rid family detoxifying hydrolase [Longimicrobium sp.]|nr:Rid family detoxifying hydrolase [Longimicrobium sp.]
MNTPHDADPPADNDSRPPAPLGPYSPVVRAGDLLFLSGQTPVDPRTGKLIDGDIGAQTTRALRNLEIVLQGAGATWSNVVKTTVFLRDMADFAAMNAAYAAHTGSTLPARSTIAVAGLPLDARVEIEAIAHLP